MSYLRPTSLSGGVTILAPGDIKLLNPEEEGRRSYLYFAWFFTEENQASLIETAHGDGIGPVYGYFTNYMNLYATGRHDIPLPATEVAAMLCDFTELLEAMCRQAKTVIPKGTAWNFAYMVADHTGAPVPVGTSYGFIDAESGRK